MQHAIYELGCIKSPRDARDYKLKADTSKEEFPKEFEIMHMPPVKNQMFTCSCTGHGVATVAEYHYYVATGGKQEKMSPGFIYGYRRRTSHMGKGLSVREGLQTLTGTGIPFEIDFPYNAEVPTIIDLVEKQLTSGDDEWYDAMMANSCKTYFRLSTEEDIKYALMHYGPVVIGMKWNSGYDVTINEMHPQKGKDKGRHCMIIYGWNEHGWKVQNSWGKLWGVGGRAILPYDIYVDEIWGVADDLNKDIAVPVRDWKFYAIKIIDSILNFINELFTNKK